MRKTYKWRRCTQTCILCMVSAVAMVGLLLWNTGNVTHLAEHLKLYTEYWGRLVSLHTWMQTWTTVAWRRRCSGGSATHIDDWCSTHTGMESSAPQLFLSYHLKWVKHPSLGDHANPVWLCEWSQPYLQIMPDIAVTNETHFTQGGITNTRNLHSWALENHPR